MRRLVPIVAALALLGLACSSSEKPQASRAFCRAADDFNNEISRAKKVGKADAARQAPLVEELAVHAPKEIQTDANTFADAMRRRAEGDTSVVDDPDIEEAAANVNRYANLACNVYERNSGI
jgi:hypothetical protein